MSSDDIRDERLTHDDRIVHEEVEVREERLTDAVDHDSSHLHERAEVVHVGEIDGNEITLHGERIVAEVHPHEWARVKVTRRVVTEERTITVPVRREELVIEYPEAVPQGHPNTIKGSTDTVGSRVAETYVLHQEVPRVEVDTVPYEKVELMVDTQRSVVNFDGTVARERLEVDETVAAERTDLPRA